MDIQTLKRIELPDANGAPRRIGDLWADNRLILVFARHFG
jgi:hypothetical protein